MSQRFPQDDRFRLLLDGQTTGVLWLDGSLRVRYANPAAQSLLEIGTKPSSAPLGTRFAGNDAFLAALQRTIVSHETVTLRELGLTVGSADARHPVAVDCTVSFVAEPGTSPELLVEIIPLDRHLRISREASLGVQQHLNRTFARHLAHEIKNPLGSIRGAAQLLERKFSEPALAEYTRLIVSEIDRLTGLVDGLLGPWQPAERGWHNLHEILEHVVRLTRTAAPGLTILRDYDPSLPDLRLNRDQMIQALLNLAKNAREASDARGRLAFRTRVLRQFTLNGQRHRLAACIEVEDDGPGIPAHLQPLLFAPLISRKPQGSGLGLSIAQELVSRNGGLIEYQTAPGRTVFSLILPLEVQRGSAGV